MARFYFDAEIKGALFQDEEGQDLRDHEAARDEVVLTLSEMARGLPGSGSDRDSLVILVRDETGRPILSASLSLEVEWKDGAGPQR
ncbi:hypothetical protein JMJ55_01385 [Belnapia sp. T6]|uniref:DUF6894 domain-containing protein n=1 Tax=Belnapia mucosa TaxID=2804532 RepID=A0ABS1V0Y7_9PROT|nr:hypothetical protein [Belnapia mucosa]MBL6453953.1 hypothetical protein [Belnapia mucosa]